MRPVIFLDVDGVLNDLAKHDNGYCGTKPSCINMMNRIIRETDAYLVITSSWRYLVRPGSMTLIGLENMFLSHGLDCLNRVIGVTQSDEMISGRGAQIDSWMTAYHKPGRPYLVLEDDDDLARLIRNRGLHIHQTNGTTGLTYGDTDAIVAMIRSQEERSVI